MSKILLLFCDTCESFVGEPIAQNGHECFIGAVAGETHEERMEKARTLMRRFVFKEIANWVYQTYVYTYDPNGSSKTPARKTVILDLVHNEFYEEGDEKENPGKDDKEFDLEKGTQQYELIRAQYIEVEVGKLSDYFLEPKRPSEYLDVATKITDFPEEYPRALTVSRDSTIFEVLEGLVIEEGKVKEPPQKKAKN